MITVAIPTYNPDLTRLQRTVDGLKKQDLPLSEWKFVLIDNASKNEDFLKHKAEFVSWHPNGKVVEEKTPGLTYARLKGISEAEGDLLIFVDDDNILCPDYLSNSIAISKQHADLGAFGGASIPDYEDEKPKWIDEFEGLLAVRDFGKRDVITGLEKDGEQDKYPEASPIGAGMVLRKEAIDQWVEELNDPSRPKISDRTGDSLTSGGDNDIVLTILKNGWKVGYFHQLCLQHIIPKGRTEVDYLGRLSRDMYISWIAVLHTHQVKCPSPISPLKAKLGMLRAYLKQKGWQRPEGYLRYQSLCGYYLGRASIYNK